MRSSTEYTPLGYASNAPGGAPGSAAGASAGQQYQHQHQVSSKKLLSVCFFFLVSLVSFVSQTELTSYLYNELRFNQPYLLLMITHGSWWAIWPVQVLLIAHYKYYKYYSKNKNYAQSIKSSLFNQHRNIYTTAQVILGSPSGNDLFPTSAMGFIRSAAIVNIVSKVFILTCILTVAGITWYLAMGLSPASDITAIYNCSAFSALIFAIPLLHEQFTYLKLSSVVLAIIGVFFVAYSGESSNPTESVYPNRVFGDVIIAFGALLYGLYEVLYKKFVCPPMNSVSSKRMVAFSNFCASLIGLSTLLVVWVIVVAANYLNISKFELITDGYTLFIIVMSIVSNLVFSLSFLALMTLTSPVLSSVSSLITILFVGLFEWVLFGVRITAQQLLGDLFVVVGFVVLSYAYWNEITEDDRDDDETEDDV